MIRRYLWAFFKALLFTLRGEKLPPRGDPRLHDWIEQTLVLVDAVITAADAAGMTAAAREAFTLHIDRRDISMALILSAVRFHASDEYPHLLRQGATHSLTAIYASNMNDHYRVVRLQRAENLPQDGALRQSIDALAAHLESVPSTESAQ